MNKKTHLILLYCKYWRNKRIVRKVLKDRAWLVIVYHSKIISSKEYLGYDRMTSAMQNYERKQKIILEYGPHATIHLLAKA